MSIYKDMWGSSITWNLIWNYLYFAISISPLFALGLAQLSSPSFQCLKWLLKKLSIFTVVLQLLMPKLYIHKAWVRFSTMCTIRNKCTFPSPVPSPEYINPQRCCFFSFSVVHRQEDILGMAVFSVRLSLSMPSLLSSRQNKALKSSCKTSEDKTYLAKLTLCPETQSSDVLAQSNPGQSRTHHQLHRRSYCIFTPPHSELFQFTSVSKW